MKFKHFLEQRTSIREFHDKKVENEILIKLMDLAKEIEKKYGKDSIKFVLYENGTKIYEALKGLGGYSGVMIKSPHYIGIQTKNDDKQTLVRSGFSMESLITKASELKLSTCWISVEKVSTKNKQILGATEKNKINYITAIGYPQRKSKFEPMPTSSRLAIEDIAYMEKWGNKANIDELDNRGLTDILYHVRYAPSTHNDQPWRFIIDNNNIKLAIINPKELSNYVDGGIIAYYFEGLIYDLGITNSWKFNDKISIDTNEEYAIIGSFKI